jgi:hypothetical protein
MYARKVSVRLKPNSLQDFTNLVEREILPWLRKQEGFLDLIVLAAPDGGEVATISFWDHQANAEAYNKSGYPEVLGILQGLLDGIPYLKTFDVVSSTLESASLLQRIERRMSPDIGPTALGYGTGGLAAESESSSSCR